MFTLDIRIPDGKPMKKIMLLLLILIGAAAVYLWLNPQAMEDIRRMADDAGVAPRTSTVYKWRDAQGNWQVSDTPPPAGVEYETMELRHDQNVLPLPPALQPKD
jgi:hypothetical protein